mmetsp:Transcript_13280/g.28828  ORF Transcript_13280/g.28828 Transcript_13280/m.28828 type:complete len:282 (+) Transcript_13280:297-1142(+)
MVGTSSQELLPNSDDTGDGYGGAYHDLEEANGSSGESSSGDSSWHLADFGRVGERSRDGSIHATDEVFNSVSHLAAFMVSLLGTVLLVTASSSQAEPWKIVSFSIYGASLLFLFGCSTLHHAISGPERLELRLRILDYAAIYPLIAGTFTPLCLVFYHDSTIGWSFCAVVWFLSIAGMLMTFLMFKKIPKWLSMTMYITLGWLGALMSYWLKVYLGVGGMALFILGGLFYTGGGWVYTKEHPNPYPGVFGFHEIWHIAVILGAASHWALMYFFVLPWQPER